MRVRVAPVPGSATRRLESVREARSTGGATRLRSMHPVRFPGESPEQRRARALRERVDDLRSARERIIAAADEERRRIQRDLHDGAQQRLVSLALILSRAESRMATDPEA